MIQKEKLNNLTEFERKQLVVNLRELYYAVVDYFHYGLDDDLCNIMIYGRPVLNELNQIIK
jgi:hypothetical protein